MRDEQEMLKLSKEVTLCNSVEVTLASVKREHFELIDREQKLFSG